MPRNYDNDVNALLSRPMDRKHYGLSIQNPAVSTESEGGYIITRPRFTRRPRRTWTFGYTDISMADKSRIEQFYNDMLGGSMMFYWVDRHALEGENWRRQNDPTHPNYKGPAVDASQFTYLVRFTDELSFKEAGIGGNLRWDVPSIKIMEV